MERPPLEEIYTAYVFVRKEMFITLGLLGYEPYVLAVPHLKTLLEIAKSPEASDELKFKTQYILELRNNYINLVEILNSDTAPE